MSDDKLVLSWEDDPAYTDKTGLKEQRLMVKIDEGEFTQLAAVDATENSYSTPLAPYADTTVYFRVDRVKTDDSIISSDVVELAIVPYPATKDYDFLGYRYDDISHAREGENQALILLKTPDATQLITGWFVNDQSNLADQLNSWFSVDNITVNVTAVDIDSYANYTNLINREDIDLYYADKYNQQSFDNGSGNLARLAEYRVEINNLPDECSVTFCSLSYDSLIESSYRRDDIPNLPDPAPAGCLRMCHDTVTYTSAGRSVNVVDNPLTGGLDTILVTDTQFPIAPSESDIPAEGLVVDITAAPTYIGSTAHAKVLRLTIPETTQSTLTISSEGYSVQSYLICRFERYDSANPTIPIPVIGMNSLHLLDYRNQHGLLSYSGGALVIDLNPPAGRLVGECLVLINPEVNYITITLGGA